VGDEAPLVLAVRKGFDVLRVLAHLYGSPSGVAGAIPSRVPAARAGTRSRDTPPLGASPGGGRPLRAEDLPVGVSSGVQRRAGRISLVASLHRSPAVRTHSRCPPRPRDAGAPRKVAPGLPGNRSDPSSTGLEGWR